MENQFEIFIQGVGIPKPKLVKISGEGNVQDLLEIARENGLPHDIGSEVQVWLGDQEEPLDLSSSLKDAGVTRRSLIHIHTCRKIHVAVNYQSQTKQHPFSPSTTVRTVELWAEDKFQLSGSDASDYQLQICNSDEKPSGDVQIGLLVQPGQCQICFDVVTKPQIQG